jgi:prepilin-type N-terminal cleavage/methylation domain-containing protein/prepilin-type processing-associated H-X9-DG protein
MARLENNMRTTKGFTLIELLIVIAIIAILAAVLFPVFASAREKARQTACLSNLKQLGLAYTQYEQDYDELVPCGTNPWGWGEGWAAQIYPYVKSTAVFLCPDDPTPTDIISYGVNGNFVGCLTGGTGPIPATVAKMAGPSSTVLLFEVTNCPGSKATFQFKDPAAPNYDIMYSPAGNGIDIKPGDGSNNLAGRGSQNNSTCPTCLKYATGLMGNACISGVASPCDRNGANINGSNSYFLGNAGLHQNGSNFLLADSHVKFLQPTQVGAGFDTLLPNDVAPLCPPTLNSHAPTVGCTIPTAFAATFALR